jgi:hypothetical protein
MNAAHLLVEAHRVRLGLPFQASGADLLGALESVPEELRTDTLAEPLGSDAEVFQPQHIVLHEQARLRNRASFRVGDVDLALGQPARGEIPTLGPGAHALSVVAPVRLRRERYRAKLLAFAWVGRSDPHVARPPRRLPEGAIEVR